MITYESEIRMALLEINLAITQLMGVTPRSADNERSLLNAIYKEMACAAERCLSELLALPDGETILQDLTNWNPMLRRRLDRKRDLSRLPAWFVYPDLVVETVRNLPDPLPDPVERLSQVAHRCDRYLRAYIPSRRKAFAFLLEEARAGRLHFYARRHEHAGLDKISPTELQGHLSIEDCGARLRQEYPGTREFYDVHLDSGEFLRITHDVSLTTSEKRRIAEEQADTWYHTQPPDFYQLDDSAQVELLKERFPDLVGHRALVRQLRRERKARVKIKI